MKKNKKGVIVALAIMLVTIAVPAFAEEPMTISGVWETPDSDDGGMQYYYFSPTKDGEGKFVGVWVIPNIEAAGGGEQIHQVHGSWGMVKFDDGRQGFALLDLHVRAGNRWNSNGGKIFMGLYYYRFTTENGTQKLLCMDNEGELRRTFTKTGTKLSDLPELGPLGYDGMTGGRWWAAAGVVIK